MRFLAIIFLFISFCCIGQEQSWEFKRIGLKEGLSNTGITRIIKDSKGYVWVATLGGLNKYNAYEFEVYNEDVEDENSISSDKVNVVFEDSKNNLWVGTSLGLDLYDRSTNSFIHYRIDSNEIGTPLSTRIVDIVEDKSGNLWLGTWGGGIIHFNKTELKFERLLSTENTKDYTFPKHVRRLFIDSKNNLWVGSNGYGITKYNLKTFEGKTWHTRHRSDVLMEASYCFAIYEDEEHNFWAVTFVGGLMKMDAGSDRFRLIENPNNKEHQTKNGILSISTDDNGDLILGSNGGGVFFFDKNTEKFTANLSYDALDPKSLSDDFVPIIYKDNSGIYWLGTENGGVSVYDPYESKFLSFGKLGNGSDDLPGKSINAIYESPDKRVWVGTENNGYAVLNRETMKYEQYTIPNAHMDNNNTFITSIIGDGGNGVWVGAQMGGITHVSEEGKIIKQYAKKFQYNEPLALFDHDIRTLKYANHNEIWFGGFQGFGIKSGEHFQQYCFDEPPLDGVCREPISAIQPFQDSLLLVGFLEDGLKVFSLKSKKFKREFKVSSDPKSISSNAVNSICVDSKGRVWLGTDKGLNFFNPTTETFHKKYKKDGLSNNQIFGVLEDRQGKLWLSTAYGLSCFNPKDDSFSNYYEDDGLLSNVFRPGAYFKSRSGELFFGGVNGFNSFIPENLNFNTNVPNIVFTRFEVLNQEVVAGPNSPIKGSIDVVSEIELHYGQETFAFDVAALNYTHPEKNQYAYRLIGFNDDWVSLGNRRHFSFTNIPHGNYVLEVKACNNDGLWNEKAISLSIIIYPPLWKTWWFRLLMILIVIGTVWALIKRRISVLKKRQKELENTVKERTQEIRLQKDLIENKNEEILDSINYAKRIQMAILPSKKIVKDILPNSFILYKPKDIVAGDFYWIEPYKEKILVAAADCTGHGVPGAMVSVICNNGLNRSVREFGITEPGKILDKTRELVIQEFEKSEEEVKDGMDIALCSISGSELKYAGAHNPLWIIRNGELLETKANKQPIGDFDEPTPYTTHTIELEKGDSIYIFSDGYADQFGGPRGKKMKTAQFKSKLLTIQDKSIEEQKTLLDDFFEEWKGKLEQLDDVCVIGIKVE